MTVQFLLLAGSVEKVGVAAGVKSWGMAEVGFEPLSTLEIATHAGR